MVQINVKRFNDHPHEHQGSVRPEDDRWMLILDKQGDPHFFVRTLSGDGQTGWLDIDAMLGEDGSGMTLRSLIDAEMGPDCSESMTEAEIAKALEGMFCPG